MVRNRETFLADIRSQFGWAVAEQATAILNGDGFENQNQNALKLIFDVAKQRREYDLAEDLADYLEIPFEVPDGDMEPDMSDHLSDEDFVNLVSSKFGWAVGQQAQAILADNDTIQDQNPTALRYISDLADMHGRDDIAIMIDQFLDEV